MLRSALVLLGVLFLPMAVWFAYANWHRYWPDSVALLAIGVWFLRIGLSHGEDSWISTIDDLGRK